MRAADRKDFIMLEGVRVGMPIVKARCPECRAPFETPGEMREHYDQKHSEPTAGN